MLSWEFARLPLIHNGPLDDSDPAGCKDDTDLFTSLTNGYLQNVCQRFVLGVEADSNLEGEHEIMTGYMGLPKFSRGPGDPTLREANSCVLYVANNLRKADAGNFLYGSVTYAVNPIYADKFAVTAYDSGAYFRPHNGGPWGTLTNFYHLIQPHVQVLNYNLGEVLARWWKDGTPPPEIGQFPYFEIEWMGNAWLPESILYILVKFSSAGGGEGLWGTQLGAQLQVSAGVAMHRADCLLEALARSSVDERALVWPLPSPLSRISCTRTSGRCSGPTVTTLGSSSTLWSARFSSTLRKRTATCSPPTGTAVLPFPTCEYDPQVWVAHRRSHKPIRPPLYPRLSRHLPPFVHRSVAHMLKSECQLSPPRCCSAASLQKIRQSRHEAPVPLSQLLQEGDVRQGRGGQRQRHPGHKQRRFVRVLGLPPQPPAVGVHERWWVRTKRRAWYLLHAGRVPRKLWARQMGLQLRQPGSTDRRPLLPTGPNRGVLWRGPVQLVLHCRWGPLRRTFSAATAAATTAVTAAAAIAAAAAM